jgi:outer membrane protein OmpA-like peptidoglycan-associated protein
MINAKLMLIFILLVSFSNTWAQKIAEPENLGENINSLCYDYRPKLTADGRFLYFTRILCPTELQHYEGKLFFSEIDKNGKWSLARPLDFKYNSDEFGPYLYSVSPDNNQLTITLLNRETSTRILCKIYRTEKGWSEPDTLMLGFEVPELNSTFALSDNGSMLLFSYDDANNPEFGFGDKDLYVAFLRENNAWSKMQNLGGIINNTSVDLNPFLASDNKTLYYSSERPDGFGFNDIYMSKRLDNTWKNWSKPINLGAFINDEHWNDGFFIPATGNFGYFNSERSGFGQGDIFKVQLQASLLPEKVILVKSVVLDQKNAPVGTRVFFEDLESGIRVGSALSHPLTGEFQISLPFGSKYGIYLDAEGAFSVSSYLDLSKDTSLFVIQDTIRIKNLEIGTTIRLNNIFFANNSTNLLAESFAELNRLAKLLIENFSLRIRIEGHTDGLGSDVYNLELSRKRAESIYLYLISKGVKEAQLEIKAFGESKPIADNNTESGKKRNRRVEFTVLEK